jgi:hypothetical protein
MPWGNLRRDRKLVQYDRMTEDSCNIGHRKHPSGSFCPAQHAADVVICSQSALDHLGLPGHGAHGAVADQQRRAGQLLGPGTVLINRFEIRP